jgi:hypothetical protein
MAAFDAELYLRITGEEMLLGVAPRRQRPWDSPLVEHARALVAVGAISGARAEAVLDDYTLAEAVRSEERHHLHHRMALGRGSRSRRPRATALKPRRVVPCNRTIEDSNGVLLVRHVTLSEDTTSLAINWRPSPSGQGRSHRQRHMLMMGHGPGGPLQPQLTDDRGTTVGSGFGGSGGETWDGHLTANSPLAADTAWIEIDGNRVELIGEAAACEVKVEPLAVQATSERYLWQRLASPEYHEAPDIEGSIDALIAAGALQADDPVLDEMRAVQQALPHHPGMPSWGHTGTRSLPEPWRSLFSRLGKEDGPEGTLALSALTPEFDGFSVAIGALESRPEGFTIEVDVAPGLVSHGPSRGLESGLAWWAADERGNHHLGQLGSWSGSDSHSSGEVNFWPPLRPDARRLSIMPTGDTSRAVITVPLEWADAQALSDQEPV